MSGVESWGKGCVCVGGGRGGTVGKSSCVSNPSATPSILGRAERLAEGPPAASASSADPEEKEQQRGRERERQDRPGSPYCWRGALAHTHTPLSPRCIRRQQEKRGQQDSENYSGQRSVAERTSQLRIVGLMCFGAPQELLGITV